MRKALQLLPAMLLVILAGCTGGQPASRPVIAYVDSILANPGIREFSLMSSAPDIYSDISIIDSPERCLLLSETFMSMDIFDNVDGSPSEDGIPDFAGERIASLMDDRYTPYSKHLRNGEEALREIAVRSLIAAMDTVCCLAAFDRDGRSHKPASKAVVLSSPLMAAYGMFDVDTLISVTGSAVKVFSPVTSMISEAFEASVAPVNVLVLASPDVITSGAYQTVFSEMAAQKGDTISKCALFPLPAESHDSLATVSSGLDTFRSLVDSCRSRGISHVGALLVDDYSISVSQLEELYASVISSDEEDDLKRRQVLAREFRIVDPRKAVAADCYRSFRQQNLFTHNIAYPIASAYITSPESDHFALMDFDESSLPDGAHELMLDMAPKTHRSYVQNQHFAGGN